MNDYFQYFHTPTHKKAQLQEYVLNYFHQCDIAACFSLSTFPSCYATVIIGRFSYGHARPWNTDQWQEETKSNGKSSMDSSISIKRSKITSMNSMSRRSKGTSRSTSSKKKCVYISPTSPDHLGWKVEACIGKYLLLLDLAPPIPCIMLFWRLRLI